MFARFLCRKIKALISIALASHLILSACYPRKMRGKISRHHHHHHRCRHRQPRDRRQSESENLIEKSIEKNNIFQSSPGRCRRRETFSVHSIQTAAAKNFII
jgi:hypothetical protein